MASRKRSTRAPASFAWRITEEQGRGAAAVAELVLDGSRQLGEGAVEPLRDDQGIIAEAALAAFLPGNFPLADSLEEDRFPARRQVAQHAHEAGAAILLA